MKALGIVCLLTCASAFGSPITFTFSGIGSGTVTDSMMNVTPFTGQTFTITATTDTSLVTLFGTAIVTPQLAGVGFSITGVASGSFTDLVDVFDSQSIQDVGFQANTSNILGEIAPFAATYALDGPVSPMTGMSSSALNAPFNTSFGTVSFTSISGTTFSATGGAAATPEPASIGLGSLGLVALAFWRKRH